MEDNNKHPVETFGAKMVELAVAMLNCYVSLDNHDTRKAFARESEAITEHLKTMGEILYKYCEDKENEQRN